MEGRRYLERKLHDLSGKDDWIFSAKKKRVGRCSKTVIDTQFQDRFRVPDRETSRLELCV